MRRIVAAPALMLVTLSAAIVSIGCSPSSTAHVEVTDVSGANVTSGQRTTDDVEATIFGGNVGTDVYVFLSRKEAPCESFTLHVCSLDKSGRLELTDAPSCESDPESSKATLDYNAGCSGDAHDSWWSAVGGTVTASGDPDTVRFTIDAAMASIFDSKTVGTFRLRSAVELGRSDAHTVGE